jgi:hypothetical protein
MAQVRQWIGGAKNTVELLDVDPAAGRPHAARATGDQSIADGGDSAGVGGILIRRRLGARARRRA